MAKQSITEVRPGVKMVRIGRRRYLEVECDGRTQPMQAWAKERGIASAILYRRIVLENQPIKQAIFSPPKDVDRHGMYGTPERRAWNLMIQRCVNPNNRAYKNYGARGIKVCERWMERFSNFFADMGTRPSPQHTLERVDNDRGYEPSNVIWATRAQQSRNTRRNVSLTFNGKTKCLTDWAEELGISKWAIWKRLERGWPIEKALTTP